PVSFALTNLQPPTSYPGLSYNSQLASWNLQLFFSENGEPLNGQRVSFALSNSYLLTTPVVLSEKGRLLATNG
ncbi:MAG: hypothetical protein PHV27_02800, partial [Mesotoga sp.]|uniref:hypothetical protein n=1 Tax=Mesotoga sp. TaxID=2053577 RepID=UPI0026286439